MTLGWIEHLFDPFFHRIFGEAAIFGLILTISFWFFEYAVIEWRRRRASSIVMWFVGATLLGMFIFLDLDSDSFIRAILFGILAYLPLRFSIRRRFR
jgi:hypothetical protein